MNIIQKSVQRILNKSIGAYPENLQNTTLSSLEYKSSQRSLSLLLTTTRRHNRLCNPSDTELPRQRAPT
ncbi:hypothetical protein Taro_015755 [Colocasia esculenta]|uniref:Uncharacterized protein n=1 Tax=Colocasia esculenta TaxID=4460 RepID=A0A843ULR2_COLES|nr:hypothetical protein [Colocasia esculenta]